MKKAMVGLLAAALIVLLGVSTIAQQRGGMHGRMMQQGGMQGQMTDRQMMGGQMMCGMMRPQIVATDDGVVVLCGNMLLKYNRELELVQKTTIELSEQELARMGERMKGCCAMCMKAAGAVEEGAEAAEEEE